MAANSNEMSHTEMAHILGLIDNPHWFTAKNTGWHMAGAIESTHKRFQLLSENPLNFDLLEKFKSDNEFSQEIATLEDKSYQGFLAIWPKHAFSLHTVKEGEHTHFIYINRGRQAEQASRNETKARVFTVPNDEAENFSRKIFTAFNSADRKKVAQFLDNQSNRAYENAELARELNKKEQKTGNCAIANSNIAWHFQLASNKMKQNPNLTFSQAYTATTPTYKGYRKKDRELAFKHLLNERKSYPSDKAFFFDLIQAIDKIINKDTEETDYLDPNSTPNLDSLTQSLSEEEHLLLIELLTNKNFIDNTNSYIEESVSIVSKKKEKMIESLEIQAKKSNTQLTPEIIEHSLRQLPWYKPFYKDKESHRNELRSSILERRNLVLLQTFDKLPAPQKKGSNRKR